MNEYQFDVNVSFRLNNILELNGHQIETPDLSPDALKALIHDVGDDLKLHLTELEQFDHEYRPTSSRSIRPVILIARLALFDQSYNALTKHALTSRQRHFNTSNALTPEAFTYWNSIDSTQYSPQVHVLHGSDNDTSGVWLGISEA